MVDVVNEPFRSGVVVARKRAVPEPVKPPRSAAIIATTNAFGSLIFIRINNLNGNVQSYATPTVAL
jgi:hypothetical protein